MSVSIKSVISAIEELAPTHLAEKWDNVGLLIGNPNQMISKVLVTLDVTLDVANYAAQHGYGLIISHHPLIFKGLTAVRTDNPQGELVALLVRREIAVYAAHTNLDIAQGGVNDALAAKLELTNIRPLTVTSEEKLLKLVVFVPSTHVETVLEAIGKAGAGHIGNYSHCTFQSQGLGTFLPLAGTKPFLGQQGQLEYVDEARLETILPQIRSKAILKALFDAHPYEEVAYDLYPLVNTGRQYGLGRLGTLAEPCDCREWLQQLKTALNLSQVRVVGDIQKPVQQVALCGGSGASMIDHAIRAGADVLVTGDVKYHEAQEAAARGLIIVDGGHFATEQPIVAAVVDYLRHYTTHAGWKLIVDSETTNKDVFQVI